MEEAIPLIATALISAVMTGVGTKLVDSWNEYRRGRKDEAQRIAKRLELKEQEAREVLEWLHATRVYAVKELGASFDDLPKRPRYELLEDGED